MTEQPEEQDKETESSLFKKNYNKVLNELDVLYRGTFDQSEAPGIASLCLITQNYLNRLVSEAEWRARALKRDIEFIKSTAYSDLKEENKGKNPKLTEKALENLVNKDPSVKKAFEDFNNAEKEAKELITMNNILKEAHITFRSLIKKGEL